MSLISVRRLTRTTAVVAVTLAVGSGLAFTTTSSVATPAADPAAAPRTVDLQILSFNDLHGNLEPPSGSSGRTIVDHALDPTSGAVLE